MLSTERGLRQVDEDRALVDGVACRHADSFDYARPGRAQLVFHLHRFHDHKALSGRDAVARLREHPDDQPRHRRYERAEPRVRRRRSSELANRAHALVDCVDVEAEAAEVDDVLAAGRTAAHEDAVYAPADGDHPDGRALDVGNVSLGFEVADADRRSVERNLDLLAVHRDDVFHAAAGTSSQTVSTCAVCGNMSKATTDVTS